MTRRKVELAVLVFAVTCAVAFAALWIHARSSEAGREDVLVDDLVVAKNADVNMPYPIRVVGHDGTEVAGFDHHGIPHAVQIPLNHFPVEVEGGYEGAMGCRTEVAETGEAVVEVTLIKKGCSARQVG